MPVDEKTKKALDVRVLSLPSKPSVLDIEFRPYEDSSGEQSLEIWVVLDDATLDDELTGRNVMQIKSAIRESLLRNGVFLFPYVRLIKSSDYHSEAHAE